MEPVEDATLKLNSMRNANGTDGSNGTSGSRSSARADRNGSRFKDVADPCSCKFEDTCVCEKMLSFMHCVANACSSGKCDCHDLVFRDACVELKESCAMGVHVTCSERNAVCTHDDEGAHAKRHAINVTSAMSVKDIYGKLLKLKQKRCHFTSAEMNGWLNAGTRLKDVESDIEMYMRELTARRVELPEMHCGKHFEEWHENPLVAKSKQTENSASHIFVAPSVLTAVIATTLL